MVVFLGATYLCTYSFQPIWLSLSLDVNCNEPVTLFYFFYIRCSVHVYFCFLTFLHKSFLFCFDLHFPSTNCRYQRYGAGLWKRSVAFDSTFTEMICSFTTHFPALFETNSLVNSPKKKNSDCSPPIRASAPRWPLLSCDGINLVACRSQETSVTTLHEAKLTLLTSFYHHRNGSRLARKKGSGYVMHFCAIKSTMTDEGYGHREIRTNSSIKIKAGKGFPL